MWSILLIQLGELVCLSPFLKLINVKSLLYKCGMCCRAGSVHDIVSQHQEATVPGATVWMVRSKPVLGAVWRKLIR